MTDGRRVGPPFGNSCFLTEGGISASGGCFAIVCFHPCSRRRSRRPVPPFFHSITVLFPIKMERRVTTPVIVKCIVVTLSRITFVSVRGGHTGWSYSQSQLLNSLEVSAGNIWDEGSTDGRGSKSEERRMIARGCPARLAEWLSIGCTNGREEVILHFFLFFPVFVLRIFGI